MNIDTYEKARGSDTCPVQPGWNHAAGAPIRRATLGTSDNGVVPGLNAFVSAIVDSDGPWIDLDAVDRFLDQYQLHPGDLIDFVDDAGAVALRLVVSPRGVRLMYAAPEREVIAVKSFAKNQQGKEPKP